jgi:outer membrane protein assembly factor BamB/ABC-type phosphate/phosphonate transport system substrate-binding protein
MKSFLRLVLSLLLAGGGLADRAGAAEAPSLALIVMDPLAAPLSCPCVKGYAQRDYQRLADFLAKRMGRPVELAYAESLGKGMEKLGGRADIVIGKRSVVLSDAARAQVKLEPVAALGNKDGTLYQTGLLVVYSGSAAQKPADLGDFRVILGTADCDEKNAAARALLAENGVQLPAEVETSAACSDGATVVVEAGAAAKVATVISSYAKPLLEGCGTIKRGDLRVIGETKRVPFVVAFVAEGLADRGKLVEALLATPEEPLIRLALESKQGFVPEPDLSQPADEVKNAAGSESPSAPAASSDSEQPGAVRAPDAELAPDAQAAWPGWRGTHRDAQVAVLPESLAEPPAVLWEYRLSQLGHGGISASATCVVVSDRDPLDQFDVFTCLNASDGARLWSVRYPAPGRLDYGNSPRATPLIDGDRVYLLGAFGHLNAVDLATGKVLWKKNLRRDFGASDQLVWGVCSSPIVSNGLLIVNPGGPDASLVALNRENGEVVWKTPGRSAAFASFVERRVGDSVQVIGYDKESLGGWDVRTGKRLWEIQPEVSGDFNVPTPVLVEDRLFVNTENNGGRLFAFGADGAARPEPTAVSADLTHDSQTPVLAGNRLLAVSHGLYCLDAKTLETIWKSDDPAFSEYAALIASPTRVLALSQEGELLLLDAQADALQVVSRWPLSQDKVSVLSHPALVGSRLYARLGKRLVCFGLK